MYLDEKLNLIQLIPVSIKRFKFRNDGFPYQGIQIYTGEQGSGKTLKMVHTLHRIHNKYPDALIVSNMTLKDIDYIH